MRRLALLACLLLGAAGTAHAAKIVGLTVEWTPPTTNTDGTALINLAGVIIDWGTCSAPSTFGTLIGQETVAVPATSTVVVPAGAPPFCFRAQAITTSGLVSAWSNVAEWQAPPTLGQPTQLSNVIRLNFGVHRVKDRPAQRLRDSRAIAGAPLHRSPDRVLRAASAHPELFAGRAYRRGSGVRPHRQEQLRRRRLLRRPDLERAARGPLGLV